MSNARAFGTKVSLNQSIPEQMATLYEETEIENDILNIVSRSNFSIGFATALLLHEQISAEYYTEYSKKVFACVDAKLAILDASLPHKTK